MDTYRFDSLRFLLVSNHHTYGVQHALFAYLQKKYPKEIYLLNHPLHGISKELHTTLDVFPDRSKRLIVSRVKLFEPVNYLIDFILTLKIALSIPGVIDVYVGFNSSNALVGLFLKALGKVKRVINYSHSYKDVRYVNFVLNLFYKLVDRIAVRHSDILWSLGEALLAIRKAQGISPRKIVHVADGVDLTLVKPKFYRASRRNKLVFVGLINPINGLDIVIEALPKLIEWNANFTLDVIGEGEDLPKIRQRIQMLSLTRHVLFFGLETMEKLGTHLSDCGIGFATYQPLPNTTIRTTDPMKTKLYMAAGLPVISTDIYASAHEIEENQLGVLVPYDRDEVVSAVKKIFVEKKYLKYRTNCLHFVNKYDWNVIFDYAFQNTFKVWRRQ